MSCRGVRPYQAYGRTYVSRCIPEVQERWKVENRSASGCGSGSASLSRLWALRCGGGRPAALSTSKTSDLRGSLFVSGVSANDRWLQRVVERLSQAFDQVTNTRVSSGVWSPRGPTPQAPLPPRAEPLNMQTRDDRQRTAPRLRPRDPRPGCKRRWLPRSLLCSFLELGSLGLLCRRLGRRRLERRRALLLHRAEVLRPLRLRRGGCLVGRRLVRLGLGSANPNQANPNPNQANPNQANPNPNPNPNQAAAWAFAVSCCASARSRSACRVHATHRVSAHAACMPCACRVQCPYRVTLPYPNKQRLCAAATSRVLIPYYRRNSCR